MPKLQVRIRMSDGVAVVTADGSKISCDAARAVEKAIGIVTKEVKTGHGCNVVSNATNAKAGQ